VSLANDVSSFAATVVRLGRGIRPAVTADRRAAPARLLELYDFEGCPYCRKVREVLCELDLDYLAHPVAHGSPRRAELVRRGGKMQAPYLVDPNTGTELYESDDIIAYLNATYGAGRRAGWRLPVPRVLDDVDSMLASAVRLARGVRCRGTEARAGLEPLVLYNMEGSPYCRKVREALSELDLAHVVRNLPKGSPRRAELVRRGGKMQVPYLVDPNTGQALYESDAIVAYLEAEYAGQR
jgi:glutathione S-transferase